MEPLDDKELDELLRQWPRSPAPDSLARNIETARRGGWWKWLLTGSIRIPVPLAFGIAGAFLILFVLLANRQPAPVESGFQPVKRIEPRIIRSSYEIKR